MQLVSSCSASFDDDVLLPLEVLLLFAIQMVIVPAVTPRMQDPSTQRDAITANRPGMVEPWLVPAHEESPSNKISVLNLISGELEKLLTL